MILFHGKPFLEYLIVMLREQGLQRILLLLGYLPEVIKRYFGNGQHWGVRIDYSVSSPDDLTVRRLQRAQASLDECFLLTYCDNYWPLQMDRVWRRFQTADVLALTTVYSNKDDYSKSNVSVDEDGYIRVFDKSRTAPGLQGVELGYAVWKKSVLELLPRQDALVEEVYPQLAERKQLLAYMTDHRYYSVGSPERLSLTDSFLAQRPAIILDRDGVLNQKPPKAQYVRNVTEFRWLEGAKEALCLLTKAGYKIIVVSNQAGIARGLMTKEDVERIHEHMRADAAPAGGQIDAIYYCPHGWDENCECRKPRPGLLFKAQHDLNLDLTRTLVIGDDERDAQAAQAAGAPSLLVSPEISLFEIIRRVLRSELLTKACSGAVAS
jgi:D-glycero-D-manno-heptose 1,7-bisphosphate phosphatase